MAEKKHYCYLLQSISNENRTYVGYTRDPQKRLRQHNGEIVGGAKSTRSHRPWRIICTIEGFPDKRTALQFEWRMHHPLVKRTGINGRLLTLRETLSMEKYTSTALPSKNLHLTLSKRSSVLLPPLFAPNVQVIDIDAGSSSPATPYLMAN